MGAGYIIGHSAASTQCVNMAFQVAELIDLDLKGLLFELVNS